MSTTTLIANVPAEMLLLLGILFFTSATVLLALATEAGTYPEFAQWLRAARRLASRRRLRNCLFLNTSRDCPTAVGPAA